jgi:hypothetical protein
VVAVLCHSHFRPATPPSERQELTS